MKNLPSKIYLQTPCMGELDGFPELETTWSRDKENADDIGPYVRADELTALIKKSILSRYADGTPCMCGADYQIANLLEIEL